PPGRRGWRRRGPARSGTSTAWCVRSAWLSPRVPLVVTPRRSVPRRLLPRFGAVEHAAGADVGGGDGHQRLALRPAAGAAVAGFAEQAAGLAQARPVERV